MKKIETSLYHIVQSPRKPVGEKYPTLIMLHGLGADEQDLLGLADYLDERMLVISARAPYPYPYSGGFSWYDLLEIGKPDLPMFAESFRKLNQFIDDVKKGYPVDSSKIFLLGFSMGAIMSYAISLTQPNEFAGVIANSGYIPEDAGLTLPWGSKTTTPYFVAHGTQDPVIPVSMGQRAKKLLEAANISHVYKEYPMGHQISEESLSDMSEWLRVRV